MEIGANGNLAMNYGTFETEMSRDWSQCCMLESKEKMKRVRCNDEMDGTDAQVEKLFGGMHSHSRPWVYIYIFVVQRVNMLIEGLPVDEAMDPVEMEFAPERNDRDPQAEENRMFFPAQIRDVAVGEQPQPKNEIACRHDSPHSGRPKDIVVDLIVKQKPLLWTIRPSVGVFALGAVHPHHIHEQIEAPIDDPDPSHCHQVNLENPTPVEGGALLQRRHHKQPCDNGDDQQAGVDRPDKAWPVYEPQNKFARFGWPHEQRGVFCRIDRPPFAFGITDLL